jgi:hypothetical protein
LKSFNRKGREENHRKEREEWVAASVTSAAKAVVEGVLIAALKRCATQNRHSLCERLTALRMTVVRVL